MRIEQQLNDDLKQAMVAKDKQRVACVRQVKSKLQEAVNTKGFSGKVDDALYQKVIGAYVNSLSKGIGELESAGDKSEALRQSYQAEIDYLSGFLPKMLSEDETRAIVKSVIDEANIQDPKQAGQVVGMVMKDHKGKVDGALVKKLTEEILAR